MIRHKDSPPSWRTAPRATRRVGLLVALAVVVGMTSLQSAPVSAAPAVIGDIGAKWRSKGGASWIGQPLDIERPTFDGVGRAQEFERGTISWHPRIGAFSVIGMIRDRWKAIGREKYGYPYTDEKKTPDTVGRFNHFAAMQFDGDQRSIYWTPDTGPVEVYGDIRGFWAGIGWERSSLGYPTSAERNRSGGVPGRQQSFQGGRVVWTSWAGAAIQIPSVDYLARDNEGDVTGHLHVKMFPNGDWSYEGHLHVSGALSYDMTALTLIRSASGEAFRFKDGGHVAGTFESGSRDYDWKQGGNDPLIARAWPSLSRGWSAHWATQKSFDIVAFMKQAVGVVGEVYNIYQMTQS